MLKIQWMSFCYLHVAVGCPWPSSFHCIASSHCFVRAHISQRTLCHICYLHNMYPEHLNCSSELRMALTEVVPTTGATTLACFIVSRMLLLLEATAYKTSLDQASGKKLSSFLTCLVPAATVSAVCKPRHLCIYLHASSCMQAPGFWKIVRHPDFFPSGIMRTLLVLRTSMP